MKVKVSLQAKSDGTETPSNCEPMKSTGGLGVEMELWAAEEAKDMGADLPREERNTPDASGVKRGQWKVGFGNWMSRMMLRAGDR